MKELIGVDMLCYEQDEDEQESGIPGGNSREVKSISSGFELRTIFIDPNSIAELAEINIDGKNYLQVMIGAHEYYTTLSKEEFSKIMRIKLTHIKQKASCIIEIY